MKKTSSICFSSGLSGSFNSAQIAARELEAEFPDRKIAVIDSLAASMGEGLLLWDAVEQRDQGADFGNLGGTYYETGSANQPLVYGR